MDDGKATLIGHMLYDAKLLFADQKRALELDSKVGIMMFIYAIYVWLKQKKQYSNIKLIAVAVILSLALCNLSVWR